LIEFILAHPRSLLMKRMVVGMLAFMASILLVVTASSQPPEGKEKKGQDKKEGMKGFELGRVLPPFIRDDLDLTEEQQRQIAALEREVRTKLSKILTDAQKTKLESIRPKGPMGGFKDGKDKKGPPDGTGKGEEFGPEPKGKDSKLEKKGKNQPDRPEKE
jgi:hypothetical protein